MKRILFDILLLTYIIVMPLHAQKINLKFNKSNEFKIVQFTDVHFKYNNPNSDVALERIDEILTNEQPDLVVFTGDIIYSEPADKGIQTVLQHISEHNIPFAVTFGNHDDEQGMTRSELYNLIRTIPGNMLPDCKTNGSLDYALPIKSSNENNTDAAVLYFFDSHSYSQLPDVKGYDWLTFDQIKNYRQLSSSFTEANGGTPLPALSFFHIPLPEYNQAASSEGSILIGTRMEKACAPALNTGMFAAMKEAGDVMGIFVGHDHDNDYATMWQGILLAYGRYTGGNTVYNHLPNGARVIVLKEGKRMFETWIDLKGNKKINQTVYSDNYIKTDLHK